jgi:hypothetical protein
MNGGVPQHGGRPATLSSALLRVAAGIRRDFGLIAQIPGAATFRNREILSIRLGNLGAGAEPGDGQSVGY